MENFTALNLDTDHWALLELGGMSTVTETRDGLSFREDMHYDDMSDAASAYLSIVSRMFEDDERREELNLAMSKITDYLDKLGIEHDWSGASEAEIISGDAPCLVIYEDVDFM